MRRDATKGRTCARVVRFVREEAGSAAGAVPRRRGGGRRRAGGGAGWALLVLAAEIGDVEAYAEAAKEGGYYTATVASYAAGLCTWLRIYWKRWGSREAHPGELRRARAGDARRRRLDARAAGAPVGVDPRRHGPLGARGVGYLAEVEGCVSVSGKSRREPRIRG